MAKHIPHARERDSLYSHEEILSSLNDIVRSGNIPHAFLFTGSYGIGKATTAYQLAKTILSIGTSLTEQIEESDEIDLFGSPEPAKEKRPATINIKNDIAEKVRNKIHPDLYLLEPNEDKKDIGIDEVRNLGRFLSLTPAESKYRIAVIDSINDFNLNSSNALLKILEEPTKNTIIIIVCHNKNIILQTIRSRCIEIKFSPVSKKNFILIMSELGYENEKLEELYSLSEGSTGTALEIIGKDALKTLERYRNTIKQKTVSITEISSIAKEIKENDSWDIFTKLFLKSYSMNIKNNKIIDINQLSKFNDISKMIFKSEFQNMDISDSLKILTKHIKYN